MILSQSEILKKIHEGVIIIDPFTEDMVGPASIDLSLGSEIRIFKKNAGPISINEHTDFKTITEKVDLKATAYVIKPNELVLGITVESVTLPANIAGWLNSRSRFARLGLMVHVTAPFIQPGISGKQVLEIYNTGPNDLKLIPGERLCQLILEECSGESSYVGIYQNQQL
jgi:dCTP deaminase